MKRISALALSAALLALTACSDSDDARPTAETTPAAPAEQTAPATPAPAPQSSVPPGHQLSPAQQQALAEAQSLPKQGTVLELMHAAGYTYMKVDIGDNEPLWIAASMMRAHPNDTIAWSDAAVLHNYNSKTLHRTFDKILFVSSAKIID